MLTRTKMRRRRAKRARRQPATPAAAIAPVMGIAVMPAEPTDTHRGEPLDVEEGLSQNQGDIIPAESVADQVCPVPGETCFIGGQSFKLTSTASRETVAIYVWSREDKEWRHCGAIRHADTDGAHAVLDVGVTGEETCGRTWPHRDEMIEAARLLEVDTSD